jgi:hypothetical protein
MFISGGSSLACPENAGAAGTLYDAVPRSLIVDNFNMTTDTETLLLDFPYQPLWTNVYVRNKARATVPLLWSRVQVCKMQIYKLLDYPNPIADFLLVNPFLSLTYFPTAFLFILCFCLSFFTCFYINFEILL